MQNIRQNSIWSKQAEERQKKQEKEEEKKRREEEENRQRDPFGFDQGFKGSTSFIESKDDIVNFVYDREKRQFIEEIIHKDSHAKVRGSRANSSSKSKNNSR